MTYGENRWDLWSVSQWGWLHESASEKGPGPLRKKATELLSQGRAIEIAAWNKKGRRDIRA